MATCDLTRRGFMAALAPAAVYAAPKRTLEVSEYPLFRARGSHRELGRQHGEQAASRIQQHLDLMCGRHKITRAELQRRSLLFQPMFERHCPHLLEEMRGLAEGSRVQLADAMACNIRGLPERGVEGCTAYAVSRNGTADRAILAGQNSDMDNNIPPLAYVLHLQPKDKPEVLIWTFGGMIGYHGMNSAGVAHFANALGGGPAGKFAMPHYPVKRMMLECTSLDQAVALLRTVPLNSNGNYVLCDGAGRILDVEATTAGPEIVTDNGAGFVAHTNHFLCPRYARKENFAQSWQDSFPRLDKMNDLIRSRYGALTLADMQSFLRDHSGKPAGICRHDGESRTVASLIAEPARRRLHVAALNPCQSQYVTYSM
ncbi:MAG TPA: C45 family peptidase [Bryobacteraceae bacterium]|nr:C45 family peptidase [Bryobacteraceae bacterium]